MKRAIKHFFKIQTSKVWFPTLSSQEIGSAWISFEMFCIWLQIFLYLDHTSQYCPQCPPRPSLQMQRGCCWGPPGQTHTWVPSCGQWGSSCHPGGHKPEIWESRVWTHESECIRFQRIIHYFSREKTFSDILISQILWYPDNSIKLLRERKNSSSDLLIS